MNISLNLLGIEALSRMASQVRRFPGQAGVAGVMASNDVARDVLTEASRDITDRYNLPASYIKDQFSLRAATPEKPEAIVSARKRPVRLARFDARQLTSAAPRAKGDKRRRIAKGRKQAGISTKVLRNGSRWDDKRGFFMPLRAGMVDGGNGMGIFFRFGPGKKDIKQDYGPAPYQAFNGWVKERRPDLQARLVKAWTARFRRQMAQGGQGA